MGVLNRFFPSTLFPVRLSDAAERRLRLAQARAEESVLETFVDTLAGELPFDRAIETYIRMLGIPEPLASAVATRTLVVLGDDVVPERELIETSARVSDEVLPVVRLRPESTTPTQALPAR
jgi:hypothetical protein